MVDVGEEREFFKVLLDGFDEKLRIPDKFVWESLLRGQEKVNLNSSIVGKVWTVEMRRHSNGLYFSGDGWREFVKDHDLRFGYFLVFTCHQNISFFVKTFDHSECRKLYTSINEENDTMDHVRHYNFSEKKNNLSKEPATLKPKVMKKKKIILEKSLKIKKKPHFKINMTHTYINKYLHFPQGFRDANDLSTINEVILTNTNGCWPVKFHQKISGKNGPIRSVFSSGWVIFTRENNLEIGDVCNFELSSKDEKRAIFFVTKL